MQRLTISVDDELAEAFERFAGAQKAVETNLSRTLPEPSTWSQPYLRSTESDEVVKKLLA